MARNATDRYAADIQIWGRIIQRGRRFSGHPRPQILTRIIHGVALYAGIYSIQLKFYLLCMLSGFEKKVRRIVFNLETESPSF